MTAGSDTPWAGDACSLVDAFRAGERSPVEELEATPRRHRGLRPELLLVPRSRAGSRPRPGPPTCRCRSAGCRPASRSSSRSPAGRCTEASLVFNDRIADPHQHRHRPAARRGRRRPGRADHGQRVRRPQRQRHQDQRRHPQPVAPRPHRRRLVGRFGRGRRRWAGEPGHRRRRRRVDPHPRRLHRAARDEGHVRAHPRGAPTRTCGPTPSSSATWPGRCATPPATTTSAPARTRATRPACPRTGGWEAGLGTHDLRRQAGGRRPRPRRRHPRARRRGPAPRRGRRADRRHRHGAGRRSTSTRRTWPPSG